MSLLGAMIKPTTLKMRLLMMALFAVGIVLSGGGIAYAQSAEEVMGTLDNAILVFAAALVFFMQAGFAFLGAGLIRAKNTVNYMTKSFLDFCIASLGFWAFGYALMFGGGVALLPGNSSGVEGFFLANFADGDLVGWFFQMVFAGTAATIIAGAMAERTKINAYFAYSFIVGALIYPIYGHWAWSDFGWLAGMGFADYAGSGVVHMIGGFLALAGAMVVGPRKAGSRASRFGAQCPVCGHRHIHPVLRLVRIQHQLQHSRLERGEHAASGLSGGDGGNLRNAHSHG